MTLSINGANNQSYNTIIDWEQCYVLTSEFAADRYPHDDLSAVEHIASVILQSPILRFYWDEEQDSHCVSSVSLGVAHKHYAFFSAKGTRTRFELPLNPSLDKPVVLKIGKRVFDVKPNPFNLNIPHPLMISLTKRNIFFPISPPRNSIIVVSYFHE